METAADSTGFILDHYPFLMFHPHAHTNAISSVNTLHSMPTHSFRQTETQTQTSSVNTPLLPLFVLQMLTDISCNRIHVKHRLNLFLKMSLNNY